MSRPPELYQWEEQIAKHFPGLSRPVLAGAGRCGAWAWWWRIRSA